MEQILKNTVEAKNQIKTDEEVIFEGDGEIKILFVGNSITRHSPKAEIGWYGDFGMAASSKETDYVHVVKQMVEEKGSKTSICICNASVFETSYLNDEMRLDRYEKAHSFNPDIIIMRIIENCNLDTFDEEVFAKRYNEFIKYFNKDGCAKVILTSGFFKHKGDLTIKNVAVQNGYEYVYLGDLGEDAKMRADGLFEHSGVAAHPSDIGMKAIAERIYQRIAVFI